MPAVPDARTVEAPPIAPFGSVPGKGDTRYAAPAAIWTPAPGSNGSRSMAQSSSRG